MVVNADVTNSPFWNSTSMMDLASELVTPLEEHQILHRLKVDDPKKSATRLIDPPTYRTLKRLQKIRFTVDYNNAPDSKSAIY